MALGEVAERVELGREGVKLSLKLRLFPAEAPNGATPDHLTLVKFVPIQMKRRGIEMRMVLEGDATPARVDLPLLKAVARARGWPQPPSRSTIKPFPLRQFANRLYAAREQVFLIILGFLSPRIVEAIAEGRQPPDLTVVALAQRLDLPLLWTAQEQALGII